MLAHGFGTFVEIPEDTMTLAGKKRDMLIVSDDFVLKYSDVFKMPMM